MTGRGMNAERGSLRGGAIVRGFFMLAPASTKTYCSLPLAFDPLNFPPRCAHPTAGRVPRERAGSRATWKPALFSNGRKGVKMK